MLLFQGMVDFWLYIIHRRIRSQVYLSTSCDHGQIAHMFCFSFFISYI